jgi:hypothetical protein
VGSWVAAIRRRAPTGLGRRRGSSRSGLRARRAATSRRGSASAFGPRSGRPGPNLGCAPDGGAGLADLSRRPHLGRRTDRAPRRAERAVVGPARRSRAAGSDLGFSCGRAIAVRPTARAILGREQAGRPGGVDARALVGLAGKRLQTAWLGLGRRACAGLLGRPGGCGAWRSAGSSPVVERARRAGMGCSQNPGARRARLAVVVCPVIGTAAAGPNGTRAAAAAGPRSGMVAAGRVSGPAQVPGTTSNGHLARHRGIAAGRRSGAGPSAMGVARGHGPTAGARAAPAADARRG